MLGWFRPTCPVDANAKRWLEERLGWVCQQFPDNVFHERGMILPTDEFFPDPYDGSQNVAWSILNRVCRYMGVDHARVTLKFFRNNRDLYFVNGSGEPIPTGAAGTYELRPNYHLIRIEENELQEPMCLVGTIAHELAHARLLGEGYLHGREFDHELLTDLTTIVLGLGIFLANSPRHWPSQQSRWPWGDAHNKPDYMTPAMYGYALAHVAWARGERTPAWSKHLNWSARLNFKESQNYLWKTGGTSFKRPRSTSSESDIQS